MSWPQSLEIVLLLSGSLSAEFDLTHVGFIDVPGKKHETDFPDTLIIKDTLPIIYISYYFILLSVFTSAVLCSKTVRQTNGEDKLCLMQPCCFQIPSWISWHFPKKRRVMAIFEDNVTCFEGNSSTRVTHQCLYFSFCLLSHALLASRVILFCPH